ncbi:MAG: argininosuccinate synthase [Armatimonadetes bacterium]|nr:MAG: argininosuccinate synthase [Armatimonadota bacterium]
MKALVIYSGGLDTTVCIPLLREEGYEQIYTVTVDVGQPLEDLRQAEERASVLGACHTTVDAKAAFAAEYCVPAIQFNADYFGYPLSTAIARPLIAKCAADVAKEHGPFDAVVHGCTGKGNDQFRIEYGLRLHLPGVPIRAPIREKNWTRSAEIEYAERVGAPIAQSKHKIWSIDENLWGRSIEGGALEDPATAPPEEIFQWTVAPTAAPNEPAEVEIGFEGGVPVQVDGEKLDPLALIQLCHHLAGQHGVGRIDIMEDRLIGLKVRENYECPAAVLLITAHQALESLILAPHERRFKALVDAEWARLVYEGLWGDPLFEDLSAFNQAVQQRVSGSVRLRLYKGSVTVLARSSPWALYSEADASFDDSSFEQSEMTGMVRTHGMSSLLYAELKRKFLGD